MLYVTAKRRKNFKIKYEEIYLKFSDIKSEPSDEGRKQFFEFESFGKEPENPDPYYLRLSDGRKWMDWQRNELRNSFYRWLDGDPESGWWGWYQLRQDWLGELHILKILMNWCSTVPKWVFEENDKMQNESNIG